MSILLDDYQRDVIVTRNGKHVVVDTRYVPWPTGRGYETQVFRCNSNGTVTNYIKELDCKSYGENKKAADAGHTKMVNKWMKETLV